MVLSAGHDPASWSFTRSTARNTSGCGMASGRAALDHRVRNAGTVGRGAGRSKPRSSAAGDMQARGGGRGEIRDVEATRLQNGLDEFVAAEGEPFGSSYASMLWGRLEPGTRLGYVAALRQFLGYSRVHGWLSPREALEGRLLEIARDGYFEGPVKKVLSGLRMAEKACVIQPLVRQSDWIFLKSLEKLRTKKNSRRVHWSPSGILYEVAAGKGAFTWPEMECIALAALSICNLLRIGEAWTAHRSGLGQLVFQGEKSRPGIQVQDVGPWADKWLRCLDEERRRRGGNGAVAFNFSSRSELEAQWVELVAGTSHRSLRWHGHRRGGAAPAWATGARGPLLQLMGGWCTPSVAVSYATPTHVWEFESRRRQPVPVREGGELQVAFGEWPALQWWGTWVRREIRELGRGSAENGAILGTVDVARKTRRA